MGSEEKRAHGRTTVRVPVRVERAQGGDLEGVVENLGALGALVSTPDFEARLDVGDRVILHIRGAEGGEQSISGEILRLEQEFSGGDIRRAFAVRFDEEVET